MAKGHEYWIDDDDGDLWHQGSWLPIEEACIALNAKDVLITELEAKLAEKEELLIELRGDAERAHEKLTIALDREASLRSGVDAVREAFAFLDAAREEKG